ncbi:MAG: DUF5985 family protein [Acidobacteriota bacterium]
MEKVIYALCTLTAALCAGLLLRSYAASGFRLLLWSGLCFVGLAISNLVLIIDRITPPDLDLSTWRLSVALISVMLLVVGLVLESDRK